VNVQTYAGTASPYNFNGLVRHYYLRRGSNVADIQVNLKPKGERSLASHEIAKRVRQSLLAIAREHQARIKVAEFRPARRCSRRSLLKSTVPTGRPEKLAARILDIFDHNRRRRRCRLYVEDPQPKQSWHVDREKAALNGVSVEEIARLSPWHREARAPACCTSTRRARTYRSWSASTVPRAATWCACWS